MQWLKVVIAGFWKSSVTGLDNAHSLLGSYPLFYCFKFLSCYRCI